MKLRLVRKAILDEPEDQPIPKQVQSIAPDVDRDTLVAVVSATLAHAKAHILARVEEYRRNPPPNPK